MNIVGIYIKSKGTFYHMDFGESGATQSTSVDRVIRTLMQRGIIEYDSDEAAPKVPYKVLSLQEATEMGAKIEPIFISPNAKNKTKEPTGRKGAR